MKHRYVAVSKENPGEDHACMCNDPHTMTMFLWSHDPLDQGTYILYVRGREYDYKGHGSDLEDQLRHLADLDAAFFDGCEQGET